MSAMLYFLGGLIVGYMLARLNSTAQKTRSWHEGFQMGKQTMQRKMELSSLYGKFPGEKVCPSRTELL